MMTISIIIPTYNEESEIGKLVAYLIENSNNSLTKILIVDGGSTDNTCSLALQAGAEVVTAPIKGRAAQMNYGAEITKSDVLYFIHADTIPPPTFIKDITEAINEGYTLGRYRTKFLSEKKILKLNAWFTRFDFFICMGGDQTLFIYRSLFERSGGFNANMQIMEEYEFCARAREAGKYKILKGATLISARKYNHNSWLKVQRANSKIIRMYKKGATQAQMIETYHTLLKKQK